MKPFVSLLFALVLVAAVPAAFAAAPPPYATAVLPTPVFNTADISGIFGGPDGRTVVGDSCGQLRTLEFIALPGTPFRIEEATNDGRHTVYRVTTDDYPYPTKTGYFIDSRFVTTTAVKPPPRARHLPPRETVLASLVAARGSRYVWGGNIRNGVPEMLSLFPPSTPDTLSESTLRRWQLRGVDCSGLLYDATGGYTPRNTSALVRYGKSVPIVGTEGPRPGPSAATPGPDRVERACNDRARSAAGNREPAGLHREAGWRSGQPIVGSTGPPAQDTAATG